MPRFPRALWLLFALLASCATASERATQWFMLNVTPAEGQADCHLLKMPDGSSVLIDAGEAHDAPGTALRELQAQKISRLALVIISHFHRDHYGRLMDIIHAGIKIDRVVVNVPAAAAAERERPWGCDIVDVRNVIAQLQGRQIPVHTPSIGERVFEARDAKGSMTAALEVVSLYDGETTPIGPTDVNDTSIVVRLVHGKTRVLFTGDLNHGMGSYLVNSKADIAADILKAPHHGAEGTVPNEFFDRVGAKALLVPAPAALWQSPRSRRIRNYFLSRNIPTYVSGLDGNVTVTITNAGYSIEKQR